MKLHQYRSYESLSLSPVPGVNVIVGENAQGKTNAVEAVFLCALGRSHRTSRDSELIMRDCAGAYVGVQFQRGESLHEIEFKLKEGERRQVYVDKQAITRSAELMGQLNVVMFSPEDLSLIKGGPAERRRFVDMELSQLYPAYYRTLQQYNAVLKQRNALLKSDTAGLDTISLWDEQLSRYGAFIMEKRAAFAQRLQAYGYALHSAVTDGRETLALSYAPNIEMEETGYPLIGKLMDSLSRCVGEDLRRGFTSVGPHRDDLSVLIDGAEARVYGSQGQQRTAALSLKLSQIELLRAETGENPVLLLDDVLSELDDMRGRLLLDALRACQSFITCTSLAGLERAGLTDYTAWRCADGNISPYQ
ncbi:MAG: DNA replication/repair protein RecF [Clostridia bacterium]|nr:DNA replication/repair protein RecF [Clostridia bacterium]